MGATSPEDYGDYFAWGETEPYYTEGHAQDKTCSNWETGKTGYDWASYEWCNGSSSTLTKYNSYSSYGTVDNKTALDSEDDAAHQNWGGTWRIPTQVELIELYKKCTWTWEVVNGVNGYKVTGNNGNSIFLPAAGWRDGMNLANKGYSGTYWLSTLESGSPNFACCLDFANRNTNPLFSGFRYYGQSVRPVTE